MLAQTCPRLHIGGHRGEIVPRCSFFDSATFNAIWPVLKSSLGRARSYELARQDPHVKSCLSKLMSFIFVASHPTPTWVTARKKCTREVTYSTQAAVFSMNSSYKDSAADVSLSGRYIVKRCDAGPRKQGWAQEARLVRISTPQFLQVGSF